MTGRREQEIGAIGLVDALGQHVGVEDHWEERVAEVVEGLTFLQWQATHIDLMQLGP